MKNTGNPWARKIDYNDALDRDAVALVLYANDGPVARLWAVWPSVVANLPAGDYSVVTEATTALLVTAAGPVEGLYAVADAVGMDRAAALAVVHEASYFANSTPLSASVAAVVEACEASLKGLHKTPVPEVELLNDTKRLALLKKAKTAKARHTRNAAKYG
jgi:hypothetical protein